LNECSEELAQDTTQESRIMTALMIRRTLKTRNVLIFEEQNEDEDDDARKTEVGEDNNDASITSALLE